MQKANTSVPTKYCIIIVGGPNRVSFPIPLHSVLMKQPVYLATRTVVRVLSKVGDCLPLMNEARIVSSVVLVGHSLNNMQRFFGADALLELIRERQDQEDKCWFVDGFIDEHVPTNTLSLPWLIEEAIPFRF